MRSTPTATKVAPRGPALDEFGRGREDTGRQAGGDDPIDRVIDRGDDVRVPGSADQAHRRGEVGRSDEERIDPLDGGDRLDRLGTGHRLDLAHDADLVIGARQVPVDHPPARGPVHGRRHAAHTGGRVPGRGDDLGSLVGRLDHRDQQRQHAEVEQTFDQHRVASLGTDQHRRVVGGGRLELAEDRTQVVRCVLAVDQHPVEPGAGDHLRRGGIDEAREEPERHARSGELALELVAWQIHRSLPCHSARV